MKRNSRYHKRHRDFEAFDRIELDVVPRYKTSGLSGNEWRISVRVRFSFKGEVVHETTIMTMRYAMMLLAGEWVKAQEPIPTRVIELERSKCDQPGCSNDAVSTYHIKVEFSERGDKLDPGDSTMLHYRRFCRVHLRRGDCGREDSDANYDVVEGPGPDDTSNVIESPSAFGGAIEIDDL